MKIVGPRWRAPDIVGVCMCVFVCTPSLLISGSLAGCSPSYKLQNKYTLNHHTHTHTHSHMHTCLLPGSTLLLLNEGSGELCRQSLWLLVLSSSSLSVHSKLTHTERINWSYDGQAIILPGYSKYMGVCFMNIPNQEHCLGIQRLLTDKDVLAE